MVNWCLKVQACFGRVRVKLDRISKQLRSLRRGVVEVWSENEERSEFNKDGVWVCLFLFRERWLVRSGEALLGMGWIFFIPRQPIYLGGLANC